MSRKPFRPARAQVNRPGRIRVAGGPDTNTQLIDISENGVALFYSAPLAVGTSVELEFQLPVGSDKTRFVVFGQVRNYQPRGESHVLGMRFTRFVTGTIKQIQDFIETRTIRDTLTTD